MDVIVTATGLNLVPYGMRDVEVTVDGEARPMGGRRWYKSVMMEGVPNAAVVAVTLSPSARDGVEITSARPLFGMDEYM